LMPGSASLIHATHAVNGAEKLSEQQRFTRFDFWIDDACPGLR